MYCDSNDVQTLRRLLGVVRHVVMEYCQQQLPYLLPEDGLVQTMQDSLVGLWTKLTEVIIRMVNDDMDLSAIECLTMTLPVDIRGKTVNIDASLAPIVRELNAHGIETMGSCSGLQLDHPDYYNLCPRPGITLRIPPETADRFLATMTEIVERLGFKMSPFSSQFIPPSLTVEIEGKRTDRAILAGFEALVDALRQTAFWR